jgi:hypothetical protein
MATEQDCLPPVIIGGIKITPELIDALGSLQEDTREINFFTEQCLILSSIDLDHHGMERKLFLMLLNMFNVLKALEGKEK